MMGAPLTGFDGLRRPSTDEGSLWTARGRVVRMG
jgi:hypothetical protein